jgi:CRP-like cAMP-binding protein
MAQIETILNTRYSMPERYIRDFVALGRYRLIGRDEFYIAAGEVPHSFGLVAFGLFRYVYYDTRGTEFTKGLLPEQSFLSSYSAMITRTQSRFFIQALENSEIFELDYEAWLDLRAGDSYWEGFLVRLLEYAFMVKERRERELLLLDAESRYRNFLHDYPGMENRVKQHIIASFLGIQPETLSRIRKKRIS